MADYGQIGGAFLEAVIEIPEAGTDSGKLAGTFLEIVVESIAATGGGGGGVGMATSVQGKISVGIKLVESKANDLAQLVAPIVFTETLDLASGTGSSQIDRVWSDTGSVASGTPVTVDLAGSLTAADGTTITFVEIVGLYIKNKSTTTAQNITVGGGSNPWITHLGASGDAVVVGPSGMLLLTSPIDGYAVTATTGDILTLTSSSGTISYDLVVCGRSA